MRNLKAILIVLLCLCGIHVQAQQLEIKGLVTSSEDKQPLIGATVAVKGGTGKGSGNGYGWPLHSENRTIR